MVGKEEICGIVDALGALTCDEIHSVTTEIELIRENDPPSFKSIEELCEMAERENILVLVSREEVEGMEQDNSLYYISGPNAFPEIPFELSEVIDILEMTKRKIYTRKVSSRLGGNLQKRIKNLSSRIDSMENDIIDAKGIESLEDWYSDILNQYYDLSFWLTEDMNDIEEEIQLLSNRIEEMKNA